MKTVASLLLTTLISAASFAAEKPDPFMGDYEGTVGDSTKIAAQVIALGNGEYQANILPEFDTRRYPLAVVKGKQSGNAVHFSTDQVNAVISPESFTGSISLKSEGPPSPFLIKPISRLSPTLGMKPPEDAVVLFDGDDLDQWMAANGNPPGWKLTGDGAMEVVAKTDSLVTKQAFDDFTLHIEFRSPFMPEARGQKRGNSGVYLQGRYEIQILDSYGLEGADNECGGIYKVSAPRVNMCAPPAQWQTYDIDFVSAKYRDNQKVENARVTVRHNGVVIHENLELPGATGGNKFAETPEPAPLLLQDHGDAVQFRNIWIVPQGQQREEKPK